MLEAQAACPLPKTPVNGAAMVGSRSIAAGAAIALTTLGTLSATSPSHGCDGPDAPIQAVVDSAKHLVVVTLGPCVVPALGTMDMPACRTWP
jgi:hypothetical protein